MNNRRNLCPTSDGINFSWGFAWQQRYNGDLSRNDLFAWLGIQFACCFCVYSKELWRGRDFPTLFCRLLRDCSSLFLFKDSHKPLRHLTHNGPNSCSIVKRGNNLFTIELYTLRVRGGKTFFFSHNQPALLNNWWAGMSNLSSWLFFEQKPHTVLPSLTLCNPFILNLSKSQFNSHKQPILKLKLRQCVLSISGSNFL
jgi:hypothetical protein